MRLSEEQVRALKRHLLKYRRSAERMEEQVSYRYEGEIVYEPGYARGYRAVLALAEKGLGDENEIMRQVFRITSTIQGDERLNYRVYLLSFGWNDDQLRHTDRARKGFYNVRIENWVTELCDLAGTDKPSRPATIPRFYETGSYGLKPQVWRDAVPLVFCHSRDVVMMEAAKQQLSSLIARRTVWVFCGNDTVDLQLGNFVPAVAEGVQR